MGHRKMVQLLVHQTALFEGAVCAARTLLLPQLLALIQCSLIAEQRLQDADSSDVMRDVQWIRR